MLGVIFADYINANMETRGWKNRDLERESGVADSTIAAYRKGRTNSPARENMVRIAAAFGDPPSVIEEMIARANTGQDEEERRLIEEAEDAERIGRIVGMIRESMIEIMAEHRSQSDAQQAEIYAEAQRRIAQSEQDFKRRVDVVMRQCREEIDREKEHCQQRIDDMQKYAAFIHAEEKDRAGETRARHARSVSFLRSCVRNISACAILLGMIAFLSTGYSIFAFFAFDLSDPTRGLFQGSALAALCIIVLIAVLSLLIIWRLLLIVRRERAGGDAEQAYVDKEVSP